MQPTWWRNENGAAGMQSRSNAATGSLAPAGRDRVWAVARAVSFGDRLANAMASTGPLCVGIDPSPALLGTWNLPDDAIGLRRFGLTCVEALAGVVAAVKPQVAFFERHGAAGFAALEAVLGAAREAGLLAVADAKRGDIDSTAAAYAQAWLEPGSPLAADAVTAVAYLGLGALEPLLATAERSGRGVFVVCRSSNPEGRPLQEAVTAGGRAVEDLLLAGLAARNERSRPEGARLASAGAVVGATLEPGAFPLGELGGPILAPGLGAQGATVADVARRFESAAPASVLVSASRAVLAAGPSGRALADAARHLAEALAEALPGAGPGQDPAPAPTPG